MTFKIQVKDTKTRARVASLETSHGVIETPAFVTVGTLASVRTLTPDEIRAFMRNKMKERRGARTM